MNQGFREVRAGFEPAMTVLQTGALPLGYRTILSLSSPSRARTYNPSVNSRVLYH